jgi:hypothetical protein
MAKFTVVDVTPQSHSDEHVNDSEPSISVNPLNRQQILISAFTPLDAGKSNGPLYVSQDGGVSWDLAWIVPGGAPLDQTFAYGGVSGEFYGGDISGTSSPPTTVILNALRTNNPFSGSAMASLESPTPTDQPFIEATTVRYGPDNGKDRFYIGYNDQRALKPPGTGRTSGIDFCLDATAATPSIQTAHIETRATALWYPILGTPPFNQDGPQVRTAVHGDGTIYAVFNGVRTFTDNSDGTGNTTSDVVVVRDDNWATGANPFTALTDSGDGLAGMRVQTGIPLFWSPQSPNLGQERAFGTFAIAVHPGNSDIVYLAWARLESGVQTLHVQRSLNRGVTWSGSLLSVGNATNAALAISVTGRIGLLYQRLTGTAPSDRWETHFQESTNGTTWSDTTVCTTPAETPSHGFNLPYLGDYLELLAMGKSFYGTFCANNTPDPANFPATPAGAGNPNGARFVRNVQTSSPWNLLGGDGTTVVPVSIDPFLLIVEEVPASADFYVRDWTDSPTSGDDGTEPSTHFDFWNFSDVWNQNSSDVAFPPDANDVPHSENALAGADNYAFARIRRNTLPATGSGSTAVNAHFLVSEFGTGSNFVDNVYSDPSDPDVTFSNPDVQATFPDTDLGPIVTPATTWNLSPTTSDHLCLAVEISAPGDPMAAPGLTGHAPGQPGTTLSMINDNNKAQRNLLVSPAAGGSGGIAHFGIVHNAGTLEREMALELPPPPDGHPPEGTQIEVFTEKGVVERLLWRPWQKLTLPAMQPGENRWIGVTLPVPSSGRAAVTVAELRGGRPVNGFTIGTQTAPLTMVIDWLLGYHGRVLRRMKTGFEVAAAEQGLSALAGLRGRDDERGREDEGVDFQETVRVEERDLRIEVEIRVRRGEGRHERARPESPTRAHGTPGASRYESFVRDTVELFETCLSGLGGGDPFAIGPAVSTLAGAADAATLTAVHASILNRLDAYMTMLRKAKGDRADILQMVQWHRDLYERSPMLAASADSAAVTNRLEQFIAQHDAGAGGLSGYSTLLAGLSPALHGTAAYIGAASRLDPLIAALGAADGGARALQRAHRIFLTSLADLV